MEKLPSHPGSDRAGTLPGSDRDQTLQLVMARLDEMQWEQQEQRQELARIHSALDALARENAARDRNRLLATENTGPVGGSRPLKPLWSLITGEEIEPFPACVRDVFHLDPSSTTRILTELKLSLDGDKRSRRRRVLLACGVGLIAIADSEDLSSESGIDS